jgi:hypothetical protein
MKSILSSILYVKYSNDPKEEKKVKSVISNRFYIDYNINIINANNKVGKTWMVLFRSDCG